MLVANPLNTYKMHERTVYRDGRLAFEQRWPKRRAQRQAGHLKAEVKRRRAQLQTAGWTEFRTTAGRLGEPKYRALLQAGKEHPNEIRIEAQSGRLCLEDLLGG